MAILRRNVEFAYSIAKARDNKAHRYGGCWVADDVWRTTDCSGIVTHILDALVNGTRMTWSRHYLCTESYRYVGGAGSKGPFGTIRVAKPGDIPDDAVLRIGLMHGPGGGDDSHMTCTLDAENNVAIESSSSHGQQVGGAARGYDHPIFHDWFYLPGQSPTTRRRSATTPFTRSNSYSCGWGRRARVCESCRKSSTETIRSSPTSTWTGSMGLKPRPSSRNSSGARASQTTVSPARRPWSSSACQPRQTDPQAVPVKHRCNVEKSPVQAAGLHGHLLTLDGGALRRCAQAIPADSARASCRTDRAGRPGARRPG